MFRKNNPSYGPKGSGSSGKWGQKKGSSQPPRKVSPNYKVNLMHHNAMVNGKPEPYNPGGQNRSRSERPVGVYQVPRPQPPRLRQIPPVRQPPANTVVIKDELFRPFQEKLAKDGKTADEVVNRLIGLYNEGKLDPSPQS